MSFTYFWRSPIGERECGPPDTANCRAMGGRNRRGIRDNFKEVSPHSPLGCMDKRSLFQPDLCQLSLVEVAVLSVQSPHFTVGVTHHHSTSAHTPESFGASIDTPTAIRQSKIKCMRQ
jgi:hypothetical protein